jgi:FMN phosphatase YigB (HAD superfamily)
MLKAVIFDFGQTIMPETLSLADPPIQLMPGVFEAIIQIKLPKGIWANTWDVSALQIRSWLKRAGLDTYIQWVVTSFEIGHRKPSLEFFTSALAECGLRASEILFVGNQLNTDIVGANNAGIRSVYLADARYRLSLTYPGSYNRWIDYFNVSAFAPGAGSAFSHSPLISKHKAACDTVALLTLNPEI